jgi:hypothetical protein
MREACQEVETICSADGQDAMWLVFRRHFLDGIPYVLLVDETGYEPARAAVVARTVANRVRAAIKRLMVLDGIPEEELEGELSRFTACSPNEPHFGGSSPKPMTRGGQSPPPVAHWRPRLRRFSSRQRRLSRRWPISMNQ